VGAGNSDPCVRLDSLEIRLGVSRPVPIAPGGPIVFARILPPNLSAIARAPVTPVRTWAEMLDDDRPGSVLSTLEDFRQD
jgi:hypothetical protein